MKSRFLLATLCCTLSTAEFEVSLLARQLVEDQCHGPGSLPFTLPDESTKQWAELEQGFLNAQVTAYIDGPKAGAASCLSSLKTLLQDKYVLAFSCPLLTAKLVHQCASLFAFIDQKHRARVLLQMGNMFKLQSISRWYGQTQSQKARGEPFANRYETGMQSDYSLALTAIFQTTQQPPKNIIPSGHRFAGAEIEIMSICTYPPDPTSNTVLHSPLPEITPPNHQLYADSFGYRYTVHKTLPKGREGVEAHYSKMMVVLDRLNERYNEYGSAEGAKNKTSRASPGLPGSGRSSPPLEHWILFVDCDAIFTDFSTPLIDILQTYTSPTTQFLVAEDTGGINSGVFAVRNSDWSREYLRKVSVSPYTTAWDQSQFFWEAVKGNLFDFQGPSSSHDFRLPDQVTLMHQRHLNAFVPPASKDWQAYEWQVGDFIRHFAGCPWQERVCLDMFEATLIFAEEEWRNVRAR